MKNYKVKSLKNATSITKFSENIIFLIETAVARIQHFFFYFFERCAYSDIASSYYNNFVIFSTEVEE